MNNSQYILNTISGKILNEDCLATPIFVKKINTILFNMIFFTLNNL